MATDFVYRFPTLIKSPNGTRYHITDDGHKTLCNREIDALPEMHPLALEEHERCPICEKRGSYNRIFLARAAEEAAAHEAHERQMAEIAATREARNAARPSLVDALINWLAPRLFLSSRVTHQNMDELKFLASREGQTFTIEIKIWNGKRE